MDTNDTQWVAKPNDIEVMWFRWSGIQVDFIRSPEWLRSMVYDWEFEPNKNSAFRCALKLFYTGPRVRAIFVQPGEFILRIGDLLVVLSDESFRAIFMEDDREEPI